MKVAVSYLHVPRAAAWKVVAEGIARLFSERGWAARLLDTTSLVSFENYDRWVAVGGADWPFWVPTGCYKLWALKVVAYFVAEGRPVCGSAAHLARRAYVDELVAPSEFARRCMEEAGLRVDAVVPHGVDLEAFSRPDPARVRELRSRYRGVVLFYNAFNDPRKGFDYLLSAFAEALRRFPDMTLVLNTTPTGRWNLPALIRSRARLFDVPQLPERVVILREGTQLLSFEDLVAHYHACDVYVHGALVEGFGLPVVEAMACGRPVLAVDAPAVNEVVRGGVDGVLVDALYEEEVPDTMSWYPGRTFRLNVPDVEDYAEKIVQLASDPRLREDYGWRARRRAEDFDYRKVYSYFLR